MRRRDEPRVNLPETQNIGLPDTQHVGLPETQSDSMPAETSQSTSGPSKPRWYSYAITAAIVGFTFAVLFRGQDMAQIVQTLGHADAGWLLGAVGMMSLFPIGEALAYVILLRAVGSRCSFWNGFKYAMYGFFFCAVTPSATGGQPMQLLRMSRDGVNAGVATLSILLATVFHQIGMLFAGTLLFAFNAALVLRLFGSAIGLLVFGLLFNLITVLLFIGAAFQEQRVLKPGLALIRLLARVRLIRRPDAMAASLRHHLDQYRESFAQVRRRPFVLLGAFLCILLQVFGRSMVAFFVARSLGSGRGEWLDLVTLQFELGLAVNSLPLPGAVGAAEPLFLAVNGMFFGADRVFPGMLLARGVSHYLFVALSGLTVLAAGFRAQPRRHGNGLDA